MTVLNTEPYRLTLHPGKRPEAAARRLAEAIINRWMPLNYGGAPYLFGPKLAEALLPLFEKANARSADYQIGIMFRGTTPEIVDLQALAERETMMSN